MTPTSAPHAGAPLTLADLYERYRLRKLRGASPGTLNQFRVTLRAFDRHLARPALLTDLNEDLVLAFIWGRIGEGKSKGTARKAGSNLRALWNWAAKKRWVDEFPDLELPVDPRKAPRAWSREQLASLLAACKAAPGRVGGLLASEFWHTLHLVALDCAERISALLSIRFEDVDTARQVIVVRAESRKGGREDKVAQIHPETAAAIDSIRFPHREHIFPWDRCRSHLWTRYKVILRSAGLPADRMSGFHRLRKTVASHYEATGRSATALLGHSSRDVTERHYIDRSIARVEAPCDVLPRVEPATVVPGQVAAPADHDTSCHSPVTVALNGELHRVGKAQAVCLAALQEHPDGLEIHSLEDRLVAAGFTGQTQRRSVSIHLGRLRTFLRKVYGLGEEVDPIPVTPTGRKFRRDGYTVEERVARLDVGGAA